MATFAAGGRCICLGEESHWETNFGAFTDLALLVTYGHIDMDAVDTKLPVVHVNTTICCPSEDGVAPARYNMTDVYASKVETVCSVVDSG